ncbi:MAG: hypothetical protein WDZ94_00105 [Patescibacteria group bacterium]
MITPLFKPIGASTHLLAEKYGTLFSTKATHTGTLDPIASGVVVIASEEDRFKKSELADGQKTYVCRVLLGFSTDTHDILGLITESAQTSAEHAIWNTRAQSFIGSQNQVLPSFSARRWQGKSFFDLAKQDAEIPFAQDQVSIFEISADKTQQMKSSAVLEEITSTISAVTGTFRQESILKQWQETLTKSEKHTVITMQIICSKRTYIRALIRDISQKTGIPACVLSLTRTQNGQYLIADCICLV